ncbi:MAG: hypothetical protein HYX51_02730 [Chloroflexi bacterium]|nr:hypothetical protein [Chloroflexota bacterium]
MGVLQLDAPVLDFWGWAFSSLGDNDLRGVFAEWLVGKLIGATLVVRQSWIPSDLVWIDPQGQPVAIEVKCSAYVQSWHDEASPPSRIVFSGLRNQILSLDGKALTSEQTYNADVYVFCLETCKDRRIYDALDLNQWEFYVLPRFILDEFKTRSMALSSVTARTAAVRPEHLQDAVQQAALRQRNTGVASTSEPPTTIDQSESAAT